MNGNRLKKLEQRLIPRPVYPPFKRIVVVDDSAPLPDLPEGTLAVSFRIVAGTERGHAPGREGGDPGPR